MSSMSVSTLFDGEGLLQVPKLRSTPHDQILLLRVEDFALMQVSTANGIRTIKLNKSSTTLSQ